LEGVPQPQVLGTITITIVADCWDDSPSTLSKTNNSPLKIGHPNRKGLKVVIKTMGWLRFRDEKTPTAWGFFRSTQKKDPGSNQLVKKGETAFLHIGDPGDSLLTNYHYKDFPVKMEFPQDF